MAKTETTVKGYVYTVTSPNGGTVTDAEGKLKKTVDAGDQLTVTAPSESLTCSDNDAVIYKVNFKGALAALSLLGGGADKLPTGYTRLDFLESTGAQWLTTGVIPTSRAGFRVRLSGPLTSGTSWGYLLGTQNVSGGTRFYLAHSSRFVAGFGADVISSVQNAENEWVEVNYGNSGEFNIGGTSIKLQPMNFEPLYEFLLFRMAYRGNSPSDPTKPIRIFEFELTEDAKIVCNMVPALDSSGTPCMYDILNKAAAKNKGTGAFIAGVGTVAQLTAMLRNLPATGGKLTLSLPAEANTPEVADMLQACHDTKGWTLTVHEYRPAAAATYSLRRVRSVVWCRRVQSDLGSYVDADGFRWQIDRCAAIFGRLGNDPTAYGYTPFDSVEQAAESWELQPYVAPEAMGDNGTLEQGGTENTSPATNS